MRPRDFAYLILTFLGRFEFNMHKTMPCDLSIDRGVSCPSDTRCTTALFFAHLAWSTLGCRLEAPSPQMYTYRSQPLRLLL